MEYDYSKLSGRIVEKFGSQVKFAVAMGMSERTLSLKMNNKIHWKQGEISKACVLLGLDSADIPSHFFTLKVQFD